MSAFAGMCPKCGTTHDLFLAVDGSIVCRVDRDAQVEAEVRERIAQEIEADADEFDRDEWVAARARYARIARGGAR